MQGVGKGHVIGITCKEDKETAGAAGADDAIVIHFGNGGKITWLSSVRLATAARKMSA